MRGTRRSKRLTYYILPNEIRCMKQQFLTLILVAILLVPVITITPVNQASAQQDTVPGAEVSIRAGNPDSDYEMALYTDDTGSISVDIVPIDNHFIRVDARGYMPVTQMVAPNGTQPINLAIQLNPLPMVEGYVRTPDGGPVSGALVQSSIDSVFTDERGYYALYVLPNETTLTVMTPMANVLPLSVAFIMQRFQYGDIETIWPFNPNVHNDNVVSKRVNINVNGPVTNVDITLDWSARITGTVTFQNGTPVAGAGVSAFPTDSSSILMIPLGSTDENGRYVLDNDVTSGRFNLSVTIPIRNGSGSLHFPSIATIYINTSDPFNNSNNLDITIPEVVRITGRVLSSNGRPFENFMVMFMRNSYDPPFWAAIDYTDSDGNFELLVPKGADGNVVVAAGTLITAYVASIPVTANANVDLGTINTNVGLYYVSGTVSPYDPNDPMFQGMEVVVETVLSLGFFQTTYEVVAPIEEDGSFTGYVLTGVTGPGDQQLQVSHRVRLQGGYIAGDGMRIPPQDLGTVNGDTSGVNINIPLPPDRARLTVTVTRSGDAQRAGSQVFVYRAVINGEDFFVTVRKEAGEYPLPGIGMVLAKRTNTGMLNLFMEPVAGSMTLNITIPKRLLAPPFAVSTVDPNTGAIEPTQFSTQDLGDSVSIMVTVSGTVMLQIESPNVIPDLPAPILLVALVAGAVVATRVLRSRLALRSLYGRP